MPAFDWYQGTVPANVDDVLEAMLALGEHTSLRHEKGMQGYAHASVVDSPEGALGKLWHGGTHDRPHFIFTGDQAESGSECIRASFPEHFVARLDPRVDFVDATAFDRIQGVMVDVARERRIKAEVKGDHLVTGIGRTFELGAPSSAARERLYEKSAEQRAKFQADPVRLAAIPDHWVRLEAQIRPQTHASRLQFASITPLAAMGSTPWLREVWRRVAGQELDPVVIGKPWRQADDDRAWSFLLAQYGGLMQRRKDDAGSWECFGLQVGADLEARREAVAKLRR